MFRTSCLAHCILDFLPTHLASIRDQHSRANQDGQQGRAGGLRNFSRLLRPPPLHLVDSESGEGCIVAAEMESETNETWTPLPPPDDHRGGSTCRVGAPWKVTQGSGIRGGRGKI
jgi:hypothetical protein